MLKLYLQNYDNVVLHQHINDERSNTVHVPLIETIKLFLLIAQSDTNKILNLLIIKKPLHK